MLSLEWRLWRAIFFVAIFSLPAGCRIEDRLIFQPSPTVERTPRAAGLEFQDQFFAARDGVRLHGWHIPRPDARSTLVWFHGNAGNISHRVDNIRLLRENVAANIFIFDYRGYGRSEGRAFEDGTYLDGEAALDLVCNRLGADAGKTVLFGRSLGAAVAAEMANRYAVQALILESPFISIPEMARVVLPFLPIGSLLKTRYDIRAKIPTVKAPVLVLHGDRDEVVPFAHGRSVFDAAPEPKKFFTIVGAGHNDTYQVGGQVYFQQLKEFIDWTASRADRSRR